MQALWPLVGLVGEGEVRQHDYERWYSVSTGADAEAVEVEWSDGTYFVFLRRWDRTHALVAETTVTEQSQPELAAEGVKGALLACRCRDERIERALRMQEESPPIERDQWFMEWSEHDAHRGDEQ